MKKILNCKPLIGLVACVLSFLMILSEKSLGTSTNIWLMALIVALATGVVLEIINAFNSHSKFNLWNVLSALVGGIVAIIISFCVWESC